jgi:hypothetical protein
MTNDKELQKILDKLNESYSLGVHETENFGDVSVHQNGEIYLIFHTNHGYIFKGSAYGVINNVRIENVSPRYLRKSVNRIKEYYNRNVKSRYKLIEEYKNIYDTL